MLDHNNEIVNIFVFIGIILFSLKLRIYVPKYLLSISLRYILSELLKKHQADRSSKGVVGNKGINIPITPNINEIKPNINNSIFILQK